MESFVFFPFRLGLVVGGGSEALWEKERKNGWGDCCCC